MAFSLCYGTEDLNDENVSFYVHGSRKLKAKLTYKNRIAVRTVRKLKLRLFFQNRRNLCFPYSLMYRWKKIRLDELFTSLNSFQLIDEPTHFFRDGCLP